MIRRRVTSGAVSFGDTADICTETNDDTDDNESNIVNVMVSGGIAGSIGKTVTAPLSRLTILFQVHSMVSNKGKGEYENSVKRGFLKILRNEGAFSFWKGNGTSVLHRFPYSGINFVTFENVQRWLVLHRPKWEEEHMGKVRFVSGAIAGATATLSCYPLDLIRTRLATQLNSNVVYGGIVDAFKKIVKKEGIVGLYHGVGTTLCVSVPNLALNFTIYEATKEGILKYHGDKEHLGVMDALVCGAVAGIASSCTTFPIDVIRRRMQLCGMYSKQSSNAILMAKTLYMEQGVRGFYRGLAPELIKVVPMVGITFGAFDQIKRLLHE